MSDFEVDAVAVVVAGAITIIMIIIINFSTFQLTFLASFFQFNDG